MGRAVALKPACHEAPEARPAAPQAGGRRARPLVAMAGNPNTGKTTLFNRLTGSEHKVGNYPGVTVDRHYGRLALSGAGAERVEVELVDVPGAYSLSSRSREEQIAFEAIAGLDGFERPDLVVVVVDATQLSRNLYLVLQVIELGLPAVLAVNLTDELRAQGRELDVEALRRELGVPVVALSALRGEGLDELRAAIAHALEDPASARPGWRWRPGDAALAMDVESVCAALPPAWRRGDPAYERALALWALLSLDEDDELDRVPAPLRARVGERRAAAAAAGRDIDDEVVRGRWSWIDERARRFVTARKPHARSWTERADAVLLHPLAGFAIFLATMALVFQALFAWADPLVGWIETLFSWLGTGLESALPEGLVRDFLVEGVIAGVGSVIVFLPQILLLFLFLGILEGTGYMARIAFLMDRIMRAIGLHGRAFVPMLSGYACAIPAIMATRTMERQRDRMLTMMVVPLMTCSARLPVYVLVIGALFPPTRVFGAVPVQGLLMAGMYLFATVTALAVAAVLGRTIFKGPRVPLILELPPYRRPHWPSVLRLMIAKSGAFVKQAGGVILVCTIALWVLLTFPRRAPGAEGFAAERAAVVAEGLEEPARGARLAEIDAAEQSERLRSSFAGRLGHALEPAIEPLGFDWKIGIGLIGAFAAREVFVSTLGVVYGVGDQANEESLTLREKIRAETRADGRPVYTPLVGLSLLVFFALACQCMSTLAVVYRETRSLRWPLFLFAYMTALAWVASFLVYQGGRALGFG